MAICHRNKRSKDQDIGKTFANALYIIYCSLTILPIDVSDMKYAIFSASVSVALQILKKGEVVDDWFQLRPSHSRTEAGTLRIKARYMVGPTQVRPKWSINLFTVEHFISCFANLVVFLKCFLMVWLLFPA